MMDKEVGTVEEQPQKEGEPSENEVAERPGDVSEEVNSGDEQVAGGLFKGHWAVLKGNVLKINNMLIVVSLFYLLYFVLVELPASQLMVATGAAAAAVILKVVVSFMGDIVLAPGVVAINGKLIDRHANGKEIEPWGIVPAYKGQFLARSAGSSLVKQLLIIVGLMAFIIPGFIVMTLLILFPTLYTRNTDMTIREAIVASAKAVWPKFFYVFGVFVVLMVVNILAIIPIGLGLIWSIPWTFSVVGKLYVDLFPEHS